MADLDDIYRGDTKAFELNFKDKSTGDVINTTGWELTFTMKLHTEMPDVDAAIQIKKTVGSIEGAAGLCSMALLATNTSTLIPTKYVYDIQLKRGEIVNTILAGKIRVLAEVSHA